jgi:hypothetical protein
MAESTIIGSEKKVVVAGIWEYGWNTPIKEADLWEMVIRDFAVDYFYMTPVSGIQSDWVVEKPSIESILASYPYFSVVFVDERGNEKLQEFKHPDKALYIFGRTSQSAIPSKRDGDRTLSIETIANNGLLWAHQACALVLYDRLVKSWR